jgi:hypothetical protein
VDYLSILHEEKRRTGSDSGAGERNKKTCRTSSDIGTEQENHNVGQGLTLDRKGLTFTNIITANLFVLSWLKNNVSY